MTPTHRAPAPGGTAPAPVPHETAIVGRLPDEFRARAAALESYAPPAAQAFREAAALVEQALTDAAGDVLTLPAAARASGYSADHLSRLIARGTLRNVGRKHAPRVLRGELPVKPGAVRPITTPRPVAVDPAPAPPPDVADFSRAVSARRAGIGQ